MTPIQAKHLQSGQIIDVKGSLGSQYMVGRRYEQEPLVKQRRDFQVDAVNRKGTQKHVQVPTRQFKRLLLRNSIADMKSQIRLLAMERRYDRRHQIGTQGRRHAETNCADQEFARAPRQITKIPYLDDEPPGPSRDLPADRCKLCPRRVPFDKDDAEPRFKGVQLLAQRRLRNIARLRGATKIIEVRDRNEIFELAQCGH
ncbi:hypothetical protein GCM10011393_35300 [Sphingopyxis bauzanensis]|nr:hypothetical protein GCM10011393_35300 [Sphingopyxis bauzanensis]